MKSSELYVTFMSIGECADCGTGTTIVGVHNTIDEANSEAEELRKKVAKKWNFDGDDVSDYHKEQVKGTVEVITLEEAIKKIEDDIHEEYLSRDPEW